MLDQDLPPDLYSCSCRTPVKLNTDKIFSFNAFYGEIKVRQLNFLFARSSNALHVNTGRKPCYEE